MCHPTVGPTENNHQNALFSMEGATPGGQGTKLLHFLHQGCFSGCPGGLGLTKKPVLGQLSWFRAYS